MLTDAMDSFMLMGLRKYEGFEILNVAAPDIDLPETKEVTEEEGPQEALPEEQLTGLIERFKNKLGDRVTDVRTTDRLTNSVARLVDPEGSLGQEMQRVYRMMDREYEVPKKVLEINPKHPILVQLNDQLGEDELDEVIMEQIYENALLIEGLHPDPAGMISRIQKLIEKALK
jgi:molecular chaperone HtpG